MVIAAVLQVFIFPALQNGALIPSVFVTINNIAGYALSVPGVFVLPILAAIWIGSRAGATTGGVSTVAYRAMINAVYANVIYLIVIFIFYIAASSAHASVLSALPLESFVELVIAIPVVICLVVAPLFAMVSSARRY